MFFPYLAAVLDVCGGAMQRLGFLAVLGRATARE